MFKDSFNFDSPYKGGPKWVNYVDEGPGTNTKLGIKLTIREFDPTLGSVVNFSNPDSFKALVCPLGLEELRTVVRYEVMHLQALIVAVRTN